MHDSQTAVYCAELCGCCVVTVPSCGLVRYKILLVCGGSKSSLHYQENPKLLTCTVQGEITMGSVNGFITDILCNILFSRKNKFIQVLNNLRVKLVRTIPLKFV